MEAPEASAFGELVRECRLRRNWTQEELAERAGISPRSVSDLERGVDRSRYPQTIRGLADAFGLEDDERATFEAAARGQRVPLDATVPGVLNFLIVDLRGYTRFTQERGDRAAAELAATLATLARKAAIAFDGKVIELRGDEALAVFTSTRQAVRAAIDLWAQLAEAARSDPSLPLHGGIGVDAGEAIPFEGGYRGGALNQEATGAMPWVSTMPAFCWRVVPTETPCASCE
jgi:transcriptional regulator with XRE-family HTH domain